jgi:hypothetical protein
MSIYGPFEILVVAMLTPFRIARIAAPLSLLLTVTLLVAAFQTEDSSVFGVPIDYATIGMRLPDTVFEEHGWTGLSVWVATTVFFLGGLGFWSLAVAKAFHPLQGTWNTAQALRRVALFIAANLLVPIVFVSVVLVVLLSDMETILLRGSAFAPAGEEADLVLLQDVAFLDVLMFAPLMALIAWLLLRLAIWPTIVLMTGWRHSLRTAWRISRGFTGRWLCHLLIATLLIRKVFDVVALGPYEMQFQLFDMPAFDDVVLLAIASEGIVCTVFLGLWISAAMVLHVPEDMVAHDTSAADIF